MELPEEIIHWFPASIGSRLRIWRLPGMHPPEELRCRVGHALQVIAGDCCRESPETGITAKDLDLVLERASGSSLYAHAGELRRGFLHTASGARIGLCGMLYDHGGETVGLRAVSSLSIRIPHAIPGCAEEIASKLMKTGFQSTLLLSPPGMGKTTLLRDLIRQISDAGLRVSVADERGEIAAVFDRVPSFALGKNTDVMSGGQKGESAMMLLRSMNPQILAFDEITEPADLKIIEQAAGCGVALLATAHASDLESMRRRKLYRSLLETGVFCNAVWIRMENGLRRYQLERLP